LFQLLHGVIQRFQGTGHAQSHKSATDPVQNLAHRRTSWVANVCGLFTQDECYNFFRAAGYDTN
jgi:hypothetical protein